MKRFNKFLVLVIFAGASITNLVAADWVMPKLDPLAFQTPQDAFIGMRQEITHPPLEEYGDGDFKTLEAQLLEARELEARELEAPKDDSRGGRKAKKARGKQYPEESPAKQRRRQLHARLAAARTFAQVSELEKDVKTSALLVGGHPDKQGDLRQGFVLGQKIVDRTIRHANALVEDLELNAGTMSVGTREEYEALTGLHRDYIDKVKALIALLGKYKDAIAEAQAQIAAEKEGNKEAAVSVAPRVIEERVAPGVTHDYATRPLLHPMIGAAANARAASLRDVMHRDYLVEAMCRVLPRACLGALITVGIIEFGPIVMPLTTAHRLVAIGTVLTGVTGLL